MIASCIFMYHTHASTLWIPLRGMESQNSNSSWYPAPHESKAHLYIHNPWLHQWNKRNLSTSLIFPHFPIHPYVGPTIISHLYVIEILRKKQLNKNNPNFHAVRPSLPCLGMKMEMPNIPKPWGKRGDEELWFSASHRCTFCWTVYIKLLGTYTVYHVYMSIINTNSNKDYLKKHVYTYRYVCVCVQTHIVHTYIIYIYTSTSFQYLLVAWKTWQTFRAFDGCAIPLRPCDPVELRPLEASGSSAMATSIELMTIFSDV